MRLICLLGLIVIFLSLKAEINLSSSSHNGTIIEFELMDYQTIELDINGEKYERLIASGIGSLPPGAPDLPSEAVWIAIPRGMKADLTIYPGNYSVTNLPKLSPVLEPAMEMKDVAEPEYTSDQGIYGRNVFYPGNLAKIENVSDYRGQPCGLLRIYPFQYNPVSGVLQIYKQLRVEVNFSGAAEQLPANLVNSDMLDYIESICINGSAITEPERSRFETSIRERNNGCELLIICPAEFIEAARDLANWKERKGIKTEVLSTLETGETSFSIREYILNYCYQSETAPQYLLLFGDAEYIPPWYMHHDLYEGQMLGTDVYYADLEVNFDYLSDFGLGRIPVDTAEDAQRVVDNILNYEQNPPANSSFYQTAVIAGAFQDGSYAEEPDGYADRRFAKTAEDVRDYLAEHGYDAGRYYAEFNGYDQEAIFPTYWNSNYCLFENDTGGAELDFELQKPQYAWDATAFDISNALEQGSFLLVHRDHGGRMGWGEPAYYSDDVDLLTNGELLPVVWSVNCLTGYFDNETDEAVAGTAEDDECFTEHWFRNPQGGAIGVVSSTRVSFSGNNDRFVWGMMDAIFPDFLEWCGAEYPAHEAIYRMGDVVNYGKTYLSLHYYFSEYLMNSFEELEWFGDPTLEIWCSEPAELTVMHQNTIIYGSGLEVSTGIAGAVCSLWDGEQVIALEVTGDDGVVMLEPDNSNYVNELELTVSAEQHLPYQAEISIQPPSEGYLELECIYLNDSEGNDNQQADYGETLYMGLQIRNIGGEEVNGFSLNLDFESGDLNVTGSSYTYEGSIGVQESLLIEDTFELSVSDNCSDGEVVELEFDSETFSAVSEIILHAPSLKAGYFTISDTIGNNNGAADPGESVIIHLPIINEGSCTASDVMVILLSYDIDFMITPQQINIEDLGEETAVLEFTGEISADAAIGTSYQLQAFVVSGTYNYDMLMDGYYGYKIESFETGDFSLYNWEMSGEYGWEIDNYGYSGLYSARTEEMGVNCEAELYMEGFLPEAGIVSFYRKLYAESNIPGNLGGLLHFMIDDVVLGSWGGSMPWGMAEYQVSAGPHRFRWIFEKDFDPSLGRDAAWIDNVIIPDMFPMPSPQLAVEPGEITISLLEGEAENVTLQITNMGAGDADYYLYFSEAGRWQEGSQLILSNYHYYSGQTSGLFLQLENNNTGYEGITDLDLIFPEEICVNILTGLSGGSGGVLLSNGATGNGANANWHGEAGGQGFLLPGETAIGGINITYSAEMPLSVMLEATITGDQGTIIEQEIVLANESSGWLSFTENHGSVSYGEYGELDINISAENLHDGNYYQQLVIRDLTGNEIFIPVNLEVTDVEDMENKLFGQAGLRDIYPNPFNPETTISYYLTQRQQVKLSIYNIKGQKIDTILDQVMKAGIHEIVWQAESYTSGVYFINLQSDDYNETSKILLMK